MGKFDSSSFNNIIREIIKKSLFTERQIEIILNQKDLVEVKMAITKGAYYRQVKGFVLFCNFTSWIRHYFT